VYSVAGIALSFALAAASASFWGSGFPAANAADHCSSGCSSCLMEDCWPLTCRADQQAARRSSVTQNSIASMMPCSSPARAIQYTPLTYHDQPSIKNMTTTFLCGNNEALAALHSPRH
jgi:hypothetical protein